MNEKTLVNFVRLVQRAHRVAPSSISRARSAIARCHYESHPAYKHYGARGITVWGPWRADPQAFAEYLSSLPGYDNPLLVLDRRENDKGYEPGNLRFVTFSESSRNRRSWSQPKPELEPTYKYASYITAEGLSKLPKLERHIVQERASGRTLQSLSVELKLTRQRVHQLEHQALRRLARGRSNVGGGDASVRDGSGSKHEPRSGR